MAGRVKAHGRLRRTATALWWSLAWILVLGPASGGFAPWRPLPSLGGILVALGIAGWLLRPGYERARRRYATLGWRSPRTAMPWLIGSAALFVASSIFMQLLNQTFYHGPPPPAQAPYAFAHEPFGWLVRPLSLGLVGPLLEELACRGQLQPRLARVWGRWIALAATAGVFALLHGSVGALPTFFVAGLLLGYARLVTRSIWTSITLHMTLNCYALFGPDGGTLGVDRLGAPALLALTLLAAGACVLLLREGARAGQRARAVSVAAAARGEGARPAKTTDAEPDVGLVVGRGMRE